MPLLTLLACVALRDPPEMMEQPLNPQAILGTQDPALQKLLHRHWEGMLRRAPLFASRTGDHRYDRLIDDNSPAGITAGYEEDVDLLTAIEGTKVPTTVADAESLELLRHELAGQVGQQVCHFEQWALSARFNALLYANDLVELHPVQTEEEGRNYLARVAMLPGYVGFEVQNLQAGLAAGRVGNATSTALVLEMVEKELNASVEESPLWGPALVDHPGWSAAAEAEFRTKLRTILASDLRPALGAYRDFLRDQLLPAARPDGKEGLHFLPDGDACYAATIRFHTSLPLSAEALHATGLSELAVTHAEIRKLGYKLFGTEDLREIFKRLREDPQLHFQTSEEVRKKAEESLERARQRLPEILGHAPTSSCTVEEIPAYQAPYTTIAYYQPGVPGEEGGRYFINSYAPETRPRYEAEVLAFHESIPGHHLQIAIAQESREIPAFRQYLGATAFVEGWALYTERLAGELGLYSGDLDRMGMLSFDTWRSARLVVDTGIHHYGWSREQAVTFMLENTPLAENNIRNEVDRYVTWPGQALAYKTGQIELLRLRKEAEAKLGSRFVLTEFHDMLLRGGAVSIPVLNQRVDRWVSEKLAAP